MSAAVERLRQRSSWTPPDDGFAMVSPGEGEAFVEARLQAYKACRRQVEEHVQQALGGLNDSVLASIATFLRDATRRVQSSWIHGATPPYVELPAALVHTGCHSADLMIALKQLQRSMRVRCSPHVAVLNSRDCGNLLQATRYLVHQLMGHTARAAPGCSYDLQVLAGWHADLGAGRVAARSRQAGDAVLMSELQDTSAAWTPLVVLIEDAEHFPADVLNDLIYSCASIRSASGVPLPITFVFALSAGVEALHRLLHRSTLVLLRGKPFRLASTESSVDQIVQRLLCAPSLPHFSPAAYSLLLDGLSEQHGSTIAFTQQIYWLLLHHFRTEALAFLVPVEPYANPLRGSSAVSSARTHLQGLCECLGPAQLEALRALPSVAARLPHGSTRIACDQFLRDALPSWLCDAFRARTCRAAALGCVQALLAVAFPGTNRHITSPRQLYLELLTGPARRSKAVIKGIDKLRERGANAIPYKALRAMLINCTNVLEQAAASMQSGDAPLDSAIREVKALLNDEQSPSTPAITACGCDSTSILSQIAVQPASTATSSSKADRDPVMQAGSSSTERAGSKMIPGTVEVTASGAMHERRPISVGLTSDRLDGAAKRRRVALEAAAATAAAPPGTMGRTVNAASIGSGDGRAFFGHRVAVWLERLLSEHGDASSTLPLNEVWQCKEHHRLEEAFGAVPLRTLDEQMKATIAEARKPKLAAKAGASVSQAVIGEDGSFASQSPLLRNTSSHEERKAAQRRESENRAAQAAVAASSSKAAAEASSASAPKMPLPNGWSTAVAAETLREFSGRKFGAVDWFTAFAAHTLSRKSGESQEQLLARFVVSVGDMQMIGFASASRRPRGSIEKRVFI